MSTTLQRPAATGVIGRGVDRIDGPAKVTGAARDAADAPVVDPLYAVIVQADDLVRGIWPDALPITLAAIEAVGKPEPHAPDAAPSPSHFHVLMHGLRHLRFLMDTDPRNAEAMGALMRQHLEPLRPALAGLYAA